MPENSWLRGTSPAFRLMIATSWLAPDSWQQKQEEAIRAAIEVNLDWMEFLSLVVDRHRTPALSWAALSRVPGLEIPEFARQELQKYSDACRMLAVRHCLVLAEVLKGFNRAGISVMILKGPILSSELYGDVGLRQSNDLDLAVTPQNIDKARACLNDLGWNLDSTWFPMTPRQWESCLRYESQLSFDHPTSGCSLELHWRNWWDTPELTNACWSKSIPSVWHGCSFQAMNHIDLALYLCSHGGQHFWYRAKWLGDFARIRASERVDWDAALIEARKTGQERALLTGLRLLNQVYGLPLPNLPGDPWMGLSPLLIEMALEALKAPEETSGRGVLAPSRDGLRLSRYERLLRPQKPWRDSLSKLLHHREDFRMFRLPDRLFWLYVPLRPILLALRLARQIGSRIAGQSLTNSMTS
jgi:Uncharacterised nucleotidyltransferase